MERLTFWTYLVIVGASLTQLQIAETCSCTMTHPQESFHRSEFVASLRLHGITVVNETDTAYRVVVKKIFKATPEARNILERKPVELWTWSMDMMCGKPDLKIGKTWIIGGRVKDKKIHTTLCDLSIIWSDVTPRQRNGFRKLYEHGKKCAVTWTDFKSKGTAFVFSNGTSCLWENNPGPTTCQERFGICKYKRGRCSWAPSKPYNECIIEHQRNRLRQLNPEP